MHQEFWAGKKTPFSSVFALKKFCFGSRDHVVFFWEVFAEKHVRRQDL